MPTLAEAGLGAFAGKFVVGAGLAAPARTPERIVARLNAEFVRLFKELRFAEFLESQAVEPAVTTPAAFAAFLKADREWAATLIRPAQQPRR